MKYTFEVNCNDVENIIKVEVGFGSAASSVSRTITFVPGSDNYVQDLDELILNIVDNIRLTVKEREEAMYNVTVFKDYIRNYHNNKNEQIILEDIIKNEEI